MGTKYTWLVLKLAGASVVHSFKHCLSVLMKRGLYGSAAEYLAPQTEIPLLTALHNYLVVSNMMKHC